MKQTHITSERTARTVVATLILFASAVSSICASPPAAEEKRQNWVKHRNDWVAARLEKAKAKLELNGSQQEAWLDFVKVIEQPLDLSSETRDMPADAEAAARAQAAVASARTKKAAQVEGAKARLREVLTPEQRETLERVTKGLCNISIKSTLPVQDNH